MDYEATTFRRRFDRAGIMLAGLCALHCFATIVFVTFVGVGGHFFLAPEIHEIGLAVAFVFAAVSIGWGVYLHRKTGPAVLAICGLGVMGAALFMPHGSGEVVFTVAGVALVAAAHIFNMRSAAA